MASSSLLFPLLILPTLILIPTKSNSQNVPIYINCASDADYTVPSTFATNLGLLLSNLTASVPLTAALFSTATVGAGSSAPAFGLAQCRPDATTSDCAACLNRSAAAAPTRCPRRSSAAVRFDLCVLRFSDQHFFSQLDEDQTLMLADPQSASDPAVFNGRLGDLMDEISSQAAASEWRFAVGTRNFSDSGTIYGMGQCTRDLSEGDCSQCLRHSVALLPTCCYGRAGGRILKVSCALRFQTYSFFPSSVLRPPSVPRGKPKFFP
ncbi:cysteine-rich repeat secretory protein 38-like [Cocos nucifera]|nr:cysteine-rich repeat secretory protein 38-like [Cocos nucifera]